MGARCRSICFHCIDVVLFALPFYERSNWPCLIPLCELCVCVPLNSRVDWADRKSKVHAMGGCCTRTVGRTHIAHPYRFVSTNQGAKSIKVYSFGDSYANAKKNNGITSHFHVAIRYTWTVVCMSSVLCLCRFNSWAVIVVPGATVHYGPIRFEGSKRTCCVFFLLLSFRFDRFIFKFRFGSR